MQRLLCNFPSNLQPSRVSFRSVAEKKLLLELARIGELVRFLSPSRMARNLHFGKEKCEGQRNNWH